MLVCFDLFCNTVVIWTDTAFLPVWIMMNSTGSSRYFAAIIAMLHRIELHI